MLSRTLQPASTPPVGPGAPEAGVDGMLQSIWRHKWVVVVSVIVATIIGMITVARSIPMYASSSKLKFDQTRTRILGGEQAAITETFLHAESEQIGSQDILDRAAKSLIDRNDPNAISGPPLRLFPKGMAPAAATAFIRQGLDVSVGKDDGILSVSFTSPYPLESQAVVQEVVNSYIGYESDHHKDKAAQAISDVLKQQKTYNDQVAIDRGRIDDFRKANPSVEVPSPSGPTAERSKVVDEYDSARLKTVEAKASLEAYTAAIPPAATQPTALVADDTAMSAQSAATLLATAQEKVDKETSSGLPGNNPQVVADRAYVVHLRSVLTNAENRDKAAMYFKLRADYENSRHLEAQLKALRDSDETAEETVRSKQNALARLTADLESNERSSTALGDKLKDLKGSEDTGSGPLDVEVMEKANVPSRPDGFKSRTLGMAAILGLLVGVGLALGLDVLDSRLRSPDDARNLLGLPILGVVPHQPGKLSIAACGLVAHSDPMSEIAEAARSVRTAVYFASRSAPCKTVLIASASKGDGKSVFASNLAIAMAQAGSRTLLIDADFRNPSLETIFDVQSGSGLSEVLAGRSPVEKAIRRTPIEGLEVLPCGPIPRNPSEMLNSQAFGKLIEQLSERYQYILLDSPPAMSVTDARILGAIADVTLYVVRTGHTSRKAADQGLDLLLSVGSRVLGAVANDVATAKGSRRVRDGLRVWESIMSERALGSNLDPAVVTGNGHGTGNGTIQGAAQIAGSLSMGKPKAVTITDRPATDNPPTDPPQVDLLD
jgi:succinoglycan biosynthesis transport protein ExoP